MKNLNSNLVSISKQMCFVMMLLAGGAAQLIAADAIPYPNSGILNPVTYTFTAASDGNITAYFAGSTASYDNELGLLVNGVSTGVVGLDNHSTPLGTSLTLGGVHAGDNLTFVLVNNTLGMNAFSDPSMNVGYDQPSYTGSHNHVYSTPYTATGPIIDSIPSGTFVSFEDLRFPNSDFNYNDEDFVFTNVRLTTPGGGVPDSASTASLLAIGLAGICLLRRRLVA
jgi:hypothetical protein